MRRRTEKATTHPLDLLLARLKELDHDVAEELEESNRPLSRSVRRRSRGESRRTSQKSAAPPVRILGGVEQRIGRRVRGVLERLDVPTREDIETLTARIVDLERTIFEQLRAGKQRLEQRRMSRRLGNRRRIDG